MAIRFIHHVQSLYPCRDYQSCRGREGKVAGIQVELRGGPPERETDACDILALEAHSFSARGFPCRKGKEHVLSR